jgi:hypothetical protein
MAKEYKYSIMIVEKDGTASLMGISALTFAGAEHKIRQILLLSNFYKNIVQIILAREGTIKKISLQQINPATIYQ